MAKKKNWIQEAVNPAHKGYCTPITKSTCTGHRKAFALTMKKKHGFHAFGGLIGLPEGEPGLNAPPIYTPSDKTQWFPESAALSKYKTLISQGKAKDADNLIFGYYSNEPYGPYKEGTHSEYEKKGRIKPIRANDLRNLDTKQYKPPSDYGALMETLGKTKFDQNPGANYQNLTVKMVKGGLVNPLVNMYDLGGEVRPGQESFINNNINGISSVAGTVGQGLQNSGSAAGTIAGGALKGAAMGTAALPALPGVGAVIGGVVGLVGGIFTNKKRKEEEERLKREAHQKQVLTNMASMPTPSGGIVPGVANPYMLKCGGLAKAAGGLLSPNLLETYDSGGLHETNPYGGIPIGVGKNSKMNTVEQGEAAFNFKDGKYIFSNRLKIN